MNAYNMLRRPTCRWEDDFKMDLSKLGLWVWFGFIWLRIGNGCRLM
jgi:hypothetical protein